MRAPASTSRRSGSGALAGAGYPLDREATAAELGFDGVSANSLDAVSDRDFVVETLAAIALGMVHLSRLAEEITWWSNPRFGFVRVADAFSTGSSMMPNKKNPDPAELVRGRAARVIGELTGSLTLLKGLPLAYQRDLQESVAPLFDAVAVFETSLRVMAGLVGTLTVDADRMPRRRARATRPRRPWPTPSSGAGVAVPDRAPHRRLARRPGRGGGHRARRGPGRDDRARRSGRAATRRPPALPRHADLGDELRAAASIDGALASCDVIGGTAPTRVRGGARGGSSQRLDASGLAPARTIGAMPDLATIVKAPKALLHDHLDGGLRPATVIDLAAEYGYTALPTTDVDDLATWFRRGADRKSLELYLETFAHTFGVMQWPRRDRPGRRRVRRGPRRGRRGLRRGPDGARAVHRAGADPRRGDGRDPRRLPDRRDARGRGRATRSS